MIASVVVFAVCGGRKDSASSSATGEKAKERDAHDVLQLRKLYKEKFFGRERCRISTYKYMDLSVNREPRCIVEDDRP